MYIDVFLVVFDEYLFILIPIGIVDNIFYISFYVFCFCFSFLYFVFVFINIIKFIILTGPVIVIRG